MTVHSDILIGSTAEIGAHLDYPDGVALRPVSVSDIDALAPEYAESYPPDIGATDISDARAEMAAAFAGEFGRLWLEASLVAIDGTGLVGSVQIVEQSPWDPELICPFIIDFFVAPRARRRGVGRALLSAAAAVCRDAGHTEIALRTGHGTSAAARHLYASVGMRRPT